MNRFEGLGVHELCYNHPRPNAQALQHCIEGRDEMKNSFVDMFGMNPYHVLFSTPEPRMELVEVLLNSLPDQMLSLKDENGKRPLDYLLSNWTDDAARLLKTLLEIWMVEPLTSWGDSASLETIQNMVHDVLAEDDDEARVDLFDQLYFTFINFEKKEATSVLELALWKKKIQSGGRTRSDRRNRLSMCGADEVIPAVTAFLGDIIHT